MVDADALKHEIVGSIPMMPTVRISIEHKIDDAPTVNAIPVEWLKKIQTGCVCDTVQVPMYVAIGWLVDMWQKEQEAR